MDDLGPVADFLFEAGMLARTPRSWTSLLGSGDQSVAEHINRVAYIGYALAHLSPDPVDVGKIVQLCMFHDISEARISDLNYVHQKYTTRLENKAHEELTAPLPFGEKIQGLLHEYEERITRESLLAKDADNLEFLLSLKEQIDIGNERARTWVKPALGRLKTEEGKKLAEVILQTDSDRWWYGDKDDSWWVNRDKQS